MMEIFTLEVQFDFLIGDRQSPMDLELTKTSQTRDRESWKATEHPWQFNIRK